jgi:hypothetical protein
MTIVAKDDVLFTQPQYIRIHIRQQICKEAAGLTTSWPSLPRMMCLRQPGGTRANMAHISVRLMVAQLSL